MPYLIALSLTLGPAVVGALLGAWLRNRTLSPTLLVMAVAELGLALAWQRPAWNTWDMATGVALFGGAMAFGYATPLRPRRTGQLVLGLVMAMLYGEVTTRIVLPDRPSLGPAREVSLRPPKHESYRSKCVFRSPLQTRPQRVLHIGDSMVQGYGLPQGAPTLTHHLAAAMPQVDHVNVGVPGTSTDCQYLMLASVPAHVQLDEVVVYLFAGNDLMEVGQTPQSFHEPPILVRTPGAGLALIKPQDRPATLLGRFVQDPPPYALRVASVHLEFPRHLLARWYQVTDALMHDAPQDLDPEVLAARGALVRDVLGLFRAEAHRRGARLRVVVVPVRDQGNRTAIDAYDTLMAAARDAGVPANGMADIVDVWHAELSEATLYSQRFPGDFHFSATGHARWAAWAQATLWPDRTVRSAR